MTWLKIALPLALERGKRNVYVVSDIYRLMAQVSLTQGKIDRAEAAVNDALKLVETVGNQEFVALAQAMLGQVYAAKDYAAQAETMYQQALALFEQIGSRIGLARAQLSYVEFMKHQGKMDEVTELGQRAKDEAEQMGITVI